jgi:hypothetical protein
MIKKEIKGTTAYFKKIENGVKLTVYHKGEIIKNAICHDMKHAENVLFLTVLDM